MFLLRTAASVLRLMISLDTCLHMPQGTFATNLQPLTERITAQRQRFHLQSDDRQQRAISICSCLSKPPSLWPLDSVGWDWHYNLLGSTCCRAELCLSLPIKRPSWWGLWQHQREEGGGVAPLLPRRLVVAALLSAPKSMPRPHWHSIARDGADYNVFFVPSGLGMGVSCECAWVAWLFASISFAPHTWCTCPSLSPPLPLAL